MPEISFAGLLAVAVVAFAAPLLLGLLPWLRIPSVVIEILSGIVLGPSLLGWVHIDLAISVLSTLGLAFLLFLAGLEIDFEQLRGHSLRLASLGFAASIVLALMAGGGAFAVGLVKAPLLIAIIAVSTSLGLVVPVLKDASQAESPFGQLVIAGSSLADFGAVILLSLFFSREASSGLTRAVLLVGFVVTLSVAGFTIVRAERVAGLSALLVRLQDTTAQIRIRGAVLLLLALTAIAARLGIEVLLASFMAGAVINLIDHDRQMTHPQFRLKLQALGYGFLIPVFFVASGIAFDLRALLAAPSALAKIPLFLAMLLLVRGLPAALYSHEFGRRLAAAAGLLQATSLPFIVAAVQIGFALRLLQRSTGAAMIGAGLLSVVIFPAVALGLIRSAHVMIDTGKQVKRKSQLSAAYLEGGE
jgi:Kef-type K+ transport system membrane component KefB